jgi:hypothetical protein
MSLRVKHHVSPKVRRYLVHNQCLRDDQQHESSLSLPPYCLQYEYFHCSSYVVYNSVSRNGRWNGCVFHIVFDLGDNSIHMFLA